MLWLKRIVGLLCVAALVSAVVHVALLMAPFLNGGRVVKYHVGNVQYIAHRIGEGGITDSDASDLARLTENAVHQCYCLGWTAVIPVLAEGVPEQGPPPHVLLTVLLKDGKVFATCPADLAEQIPSSVDAGPAWYKDLESAARNYLQGKVVVRSWGVSGGEQDAGRLISLWAVNDQQSMFTFADYIELPEGVDPPDPVLRQRALLGLLSFIFLLPLWVGMDASWRGMRPWAWGLLTLITGLIGLLAYLIARLAPPRPCPNCGEPVFAKFKRCPACGVKLLPPRCPVCGTKLKKSWLHCPVCVDNQPAAEEEMESVRVDAEVQPVQGVLPVPSESDSVEVVEPAVEPPVGGVWGRVTSRVTSQAVAGARVYLDTSRMDRESVTDADGAFLLADIPAGPYTVLVEREGFAAQTKLAQVKQGARVTLDFALEPDDQSAAVEQVR